ncbi:AI-2E family transporter [Marinihelvus fidelis]|uniref:AI-2E family transporter n=1 Tax=Marinihelvus fidelis TaxID=2613842 RepID=A0A5N0T7N9_9GAMM|nr:AI-2E family transporter [Marinihelvus fidelis]KAA9129836.1 AI-2E family transporter [Marinihelvus fidelis]
MDFLKAWFQRTFSDPQIVLLALILVIGALIVFGLGAMLWPVFASLVVAYLLEGAVQLLQRFGLGRLPAVIIVFLFFLASLFLLLFGLVPMLSRQLTQLLTALPNYISQGQELLVELPRRYPQLVSEAQVNAVTENISVEIGRWGQQALSWSLASVANLAGLVILLVLVPVLVFFFLKDKDRIIGWYVGFLPAHRDLVSRVWTEVESQIANYVRGKFGEIIIVGSVAYIAFLLLGLQYAALLATVVGFSVLIPYVGAFSATIPVAMVAYFQFGWGWDFGWVVIVYTIIQILDGNVLVPLMFSEAVNLHPVAIIVAILVFGGLWGFWGIFFAIPLATVVNAVINAWPRQAVVTGDA